MFQNSYNSAHSDDSESRPLLRNGQDENDSNARLRRGEATFSSKVTHSANVGEDCRFVLLGGDDSAKRAACSFILRQTQETCDQGWEVKENNVQERRLTVAVSPSSWLESLRSSFFLSRGIKKIKTDIQKCVSKVFPGPHAFLFVIRDGRDTGKVYKLVKAVAVVFGKEALDYSMVLIIRGSGEQHSEPASLKCVKDCGKRFHFLDNTDNSVQNLFRKVENMVVNKKMKFFIPSNYKYFMETDFKQWEEKQKKEISDLKTSLDKCRDEKDKIIQGLKVDLDAARSREQVLKAQLPASRRDKETKTQFIFQQNDLSQRNQNESRKEEVEVEREETEENPQLAEIRKRGSSREEPFTNFPMD